MRGVMYSTHHRKVERREPDYAGRLNVGGRIFRVAGWYEAPAEGRREARIALALEDEEVWRHRRQGVDGFKPRPAQPSAERRQEDAFADEIPF